MDVNLKEITAQNYELVSELELPDEQQDQLAHNDWSMLQSHYIDSCNARAIVLDEEVVGFVMWVYVSEHLASIWRLMVAHEHQKKGIGSRALELVIAEARASAGIHEIEISYSPGNDIAKKLYKKIGFRELEVQESIDELSAVMKLSS